MQVINFIQSANSGQALLAHCICCGMKYSQVVELLKEQGHYIPEDQFIAYEKVINIQMNLDIGTRQDERG